MTITDYETANTGSARRFISGRPVSPGEVLLEEFLAPLGISQRALARAIDVPPIRVSEIVRGMRGITADTALRLAAFFETTPEFWLNLQSGWEIARLKALPSADYRAIRPFQRNLRAADAVQPVDA